jgi:hypothetical protein
MRELLERQKKTPRERESKKHNIPMRTDFKLMCAKSAPSDPEMKNEVSFA